MNDEKENLVFWERVRGVLLYIREALYQGPWGLIPRPSRLIEALV
jgi:hypothetical protein